jgi:hypothetical protein
MTCFLKNFSTNISSHAGRNVFIVIFSVNFLSFALKGQYIPARRIAAGSISQEINAL